MHPYVLLTPNFPIPTYFLVITIISCLCLLWAFAKAKQANQDIRIALDLTLTIMVGGLVGARLFHVFYENFEYYRLFPMEAFKLWEGGYVYYGGWIGAFIATALTMRIYRLNVKLWLDFFAPILAFAYGAGRLACFFNGCCYGKLCDLPWAIEFHFPGVIEGLRHPTQLYATAWELIITLPVLLCMQKRWSLGSGRLFYLWMIVHGIGRIVMEAFRADDRGAALAGMSVATWISLVFVCFGAILLQRNSQGQH